MTQVIQGRYYNFRYKVVDLNNHESYSDILQVWTCELPSQPGTPFWIESTETSIEIRWSEPQDDGGCPITEYKIFRNDGVQVMTDQSAGLPYLNQIVVTEFPHNSVGQRFSFTVKVFTDYAIEGIQSDESESIILADLPDRPVSAPTRNVATSSSMVAVNIVTVPGDHGSPI